MRKYLQCIILVTMCQCAEAQSYHPFPENDAVWTLLELSAPTVRYASYIIQTGDTLINGNSYHKIYREPIYPTGYPFADTGYMGAIRQNVNLMQVYIFLRNDSVERLLYDFSEDTLDAPFPNTIQKFDTTATIYMIGKLHWGYTGVDSTLGYGYTDSNDLDFLGGQFYPVLDQGIGAVRGGLISKVGLFPAPGVNGYSLLEYIFCLYSGDTLIYNGINSSDSTGSGCISLLTAGITALPNGIHLRVTPNPINDYIYIAYNDLPAEHQHYFTVYNLLGQVVLTQPLAPASTTLPCANWHAGIYIWQVTDETGGKLTEGKVVKE